MGSTSYPWGLHSFGNKMINLYGFGLLITFWGYIYMGGGLYIQQGIFFFLTRGGLNALIFGTPRNFHIIVIQAHGFVSRQGRSFHGQTRAYTTSACGVRLFGFFWCVVGVLRDQVPPLRLWFVVLCGLLVRGWALGFSNGGVF